MMYFKQRYSKTLERTFLKYNKSNEQPDIRAKKVYENGYYIKDIQNLDGFIENQANAFLILNWEYPF